MDDMWSEKAWDDIIMMFPDDNNGSRIMLTTRLLYVAAYVESSSRVHEMHSKVGICFDGKCLEKNTVLLNWKTHWEEDCKKL